MKGDGLYLQHIQECVKRIENYTQPGQEHFLATVMVQDAVFRNFEVIGEAANRLSADFRAAHSEIPWNKVVAFRNVLIHDYLGVNPVRVWQTVVSDLPRLKQFLESISKTLQHND